MTMYRMYKLPILHTSGKTFRPSGDFLVRYFRDAF